jgi:hypothetical protein
MWLSFDWSIDLFTASPFVVCISRTISSSTLREKLDEQKSLVISYDCIHHSPRNFSYGPSDDGLIVCRSQI